MEKSFTWSEYLVSSVKCKMNFGWAIFHFYPVANVRGEWSINELDAVSDEIFFLSLDKMLRLGFYR